MPKTFRAALLTVFAALGILIAFVTIVGGSLLTEQAVETLGIPEDAWTAVSLLRFPVVLVLVALAVAALFRFGPNVAISFRYCLVGGFAFAVLWLVATVGFGLYVANFANYSNTYGALGGVVVLMLWFYLTALLLLVAAELTALLAKEREPHKLEARRPRRSQRAGHAVPAQAEAAAAAGTSRPDRQRRPTLPRPRASRPRDPTTRRAPTAASQPVRAAPGLTAGAEPRLRGARARHAGVVAPGWSPARAGLLTRATVRAASWPRRTDPGGHRRLTRVRRSRDRLATKIEHSRPSAASRCRQPRRRPVARRVPGWEPSRCAVSSDSSWPACLLLSAAPAATGGRTRPRRSRRRSPRRPTRTSTGPVSAGAAASCATAARWPSGVDVNPDPDVRV